MLVNRKKIVPWRITFDTNPDQCNLHCIMCERHSEYNLKKDKVKRIMDFSIIEKVIKDTVNHGLKEIIPSTMGEPLLYKNFEGLLDVIKKHNLKLNLTTNGTFPRLGVEEWGKMIMPVASDIKISINGVSKRVNELIMGGINSKKQNQNIKKLVEIRDSYRENSINRPTITFQATFMKTNLEELTELLRMAIETDIDRFKGHHIWITHQELENESLFHSKSNIDNWNDTVEKMKLIVENIRLDNGNKIKLENIYQIPHNNNNSFIPDNFICPFLGREAWIAWDGTFNVCCAPEVLRKRFGDFGNILNIKFTDIWGGENYNKLVEGWGDHNICRSCNMRRPINKVPGCKSD